MAQRPAASLRSALLSVTCSCEVQGLFEVSRKHKNTQFHGEPHRQLAQPGFLPDLLL